MTYAVLAGYRMLQEMPREWQIIRQAHAVRAPLGTDGRLPAGTRQLGKAAFSLLVVSLRKGERMAQSLESRGLGLSPRTTWRPVPLARADWLMAAAVLAVLVLVLAFSSALGYLEGYEVLWGTAPGSVDSGLSQENEILRRAAAFPRPGTAPNRYSRWSSTLPPTESP